MTSCVFLIWKNKLYLILLVYCWLFDSILYGLFEVNCLWHSNARYYNFHETHLQISFVWSVNFDEELIFRVYSRFLIFLAFVQLQKALTSVLHFCYCYSIVYNLPTTCFTALNNEPRGQTFWIFFLNEKSLINESRTIRLIAKRLIR